jgi:hypothetical protein
MGIHTSTLTLLSMVDVNPTTVLYSYGHDYPSSQGI